MRSSFFFFILLVALAVNIGCSRSADDSNSADAAPLATETPLPQFTDAAQALAEGTRLLDTGETEKAIQALDQAIALNPDLAEAYFRLGIAHALIEIRDQTAEKVGEAPTPTPETKQKKAEAERSNSEKAFEKAVAAYKKLIDANGEDHTAYYNLGRSYNKLNEDEDAAKALKKAVELNPEDTEYQTELGAILIKLAQYNEAVRPLKKALELDADNIRAEELLADAEAGKKRINYTTVKKEDKRTDKPDADTNANTAPDDPAPQPPVKKELKPKPTP